MVRLEAFCKTHTLNKSDEELSNSFDSFFDSNDTLDDAAKEKNLNDLKALDEIILALYELAPKLKQS